MQQWYGLSDPMMEDALYDSESMRRFAGIDLEIDAVPDETTILHFRHLLEKHELTKKIFEETKHYLSEKGMLLREGTIVDATIISAPSSTKNRDNARDPEMKQTKKGNQWYFGMKAHIGVDSQTKLVHSVVATSANVHDSVVIGDLLHGEETRVWGDSAYTGQTETITDHAPRARDFTQQKGSRYRKLTEDERRKNRNKSRVRAKVEHVFGVMKGQFGFTRVRYKGLAKNAHYLFVSCALVNMVMARKTLLRQQAV